ncbi:MAG: alpha/beta fold hydrolase [Steroidobacter sp.]
MPNLRSYLWTATAGWALTCGLAHAAGKEALAACTLPDVDRPAKCGVFEVPENRQQPNGRKLQIHVAVVSASSAQPQPDPIVVLMGGPGEEAVIAAGYYAKQFATLLKDRDLLLIDQRGTGRSNGLRCDLHPKGVDTATVLSDVYPLASVRECAQRLSKQADLTQYTYAHFAEDLEHIRRALGYGPMNLSSGSYGTRAAQVFIRTYPDSVRTVFFGSVVPIDIPTPPTFAKSTNDVIDKIFAACARDAACRVAYPNVRQEFTEILAQLDKGVRVTVPGSAQPVPLARGRVVERFRSISYRRDGSGTVPWIIHQAHGGNWQPIVDSLMSDVGARSFDSDVSMGLFFTITCNEDVPFIDERDVEQAKGTTYLGDYRVRQQRAACALWPKVTLPAGYRSPVRSAVPALFVSGDYDPASPLWTTDHAGAGFSNRFRVVMRGYGHTEWNDCVARVNERFVMTGSVAGLDRISCDNPLPLKFKT